MIVNDFLKIKILNSFFKLNYLFFNLSVFLNLINLLKFLLQNLSSPIRISTFFIKNI